MRRLDRIALGCALTTSVILLALLAWNLRVRPHVPLWPLAEDWHTFAFSDEQEGGQSRVLFLQEEKGLLRSSLQYGTHANRYGGIGFVPVDKGLRDVTGTNSVHTRYRTRATAPLRLQIRLDLAGHTQPGIPLSERCLLADLPPSPDWSAASLPLSEFKTPGWWYQANQLSPSFPDSADLSRFLGLNIIHSELTPGGLPQDIEIRALSLEGSWDPSLWIGALLPLPGLGFLLWRARRKPLPVPPSDPEPIRPFGFPLETQPQEEKDFLRITQLIASRYSDPELSLSVINRDTGIPEAKISAILEKRTQLRFKPYLNQVRIAEAARLLTQSDQSITEIAFLVGYGNTTHFNRVFRGLQQVSPSEYRRISSRT